MMIEAGAAVDAGMLDRALTKARTLIATLSKDFELRIAHGPAALVDGRGSSMAAAQIV